MAIGAIMAAVGTVASSVVKAKGAKSAARSQMAAANRASAISEGQFDETKSLFAPFATGEGAGNAYQVQQALSGALGVDAQTQAFADYRESPGVAWQREQGLKGIEQGLSAAGVGGGTRLKAISQYNQGLAMQDFSNQFGRLGNVVNTGMNARSALAQIGERNAAERAQTAMGYGAAKAGGQLGRAAAFSSGIQGLTNIATRAYSGRGQS